MKKLIAPAVTLFIMFLATSASATDARVLGPLQSTGSASIVGEANGLWYVSAIDYDKKGLEFEVDVYPQANGSMKHYKLEANFGQYTVIVKSLILNNKFSILYVPYDKRPGQRDYYRVTKESGTNGAPKVFMQQYDLSTLKPSGGPEVVFDDSKDGFAMAAFNTATSEDGSKVALLFKSTELGKKYKLMVYDSKAGLLYAKTYNQPEEKGYCSTPILNVSNDGKVLLLAKAVQGFMHFTAAPVNFYFTTITAQGTASKALKIASPIGDKFITDPAAQWVNDGQVVIAYGFYKDKSSSQVTSMEVSKYDAGLKEVSKKQVPADPKLLDQANQIEKGKDGYFSQEFNEILPLSNGGFALVTECHHTKTESSDHFTHTISTNNFGIIYRFDDKLNVTGTTFLAKKQQGSEFSSFMFGIKPYHVGEDVYLIYTEDYKEKIVESVQLFSMKIPANGGPGVVQKLLKTSDGYLPSIEDMVSGANGKLLTTAIKYKKGFYTGSVAGLNFIQVDCGSVNEH